IEGNPLVGPAGIALDRLAFRRVDRVEVRVGTNAGCAIEAAYGKHAGFGLSTPGQEALSGFAPVAEVAGAYQRNLVMIGGAEIVLQAIVMKLHHRAVASEYLNALYSSPGVDDAGATQWPFRRATGVLRKWLHRFVQDGRKNVRTLIGVHAPGQ